MNTSNSPRAVSRATSRFAPFKLALRKFAFFKFKIEEVTVLLQIIQKAIFWTNGGHFSLPRYQTIGDKADFDASAILPRLELTFLERTHNPSKPLIVGCFHGFKGAVETGKQAMKEMASGLPTIIR